MKDGVLTVNGKEYVFHKASGEYEWQTTLSCHATYLFQIANLDLNQEPSLSHHLVVIVHALNFRRAVGDKTTTDYPARLVL